MSTTSNIVDFIKSHPGTTNADISVAIGITSQQASGFTSYIIKQPKFGITAKVVSRTLSNVPINGFYHKASDNVPKASDNVPKATTAPEIVEAAAKPRKAKPSFLDSMIDELAASIAAQLAGKVKTRLIAELERFTPTTAPAPEIQVAELLGKLALPAPAPASTKRLPKVGVVGLLPIQAGEISAEFGASMDLTFWDGGDHSALKSMAKNCDVVFIHTRHARHSWDQTLQSHGTNIQRVTGGVSNLKHAVMAHFAGAENAGSR